MIHRYIAEAVDNPGHGPGRGTRESCRFAGARPAWWVPPAFGYAVNMSTAVVSVRLDSEVKDRLDALSAATGRPAAFYVREALVEHLDELEYAYAIAGEAEAIRRGEIETVSSVDLATELFG